MGGKTEYRVSIITVCLNSFHTIEQAILSVLEQTYKEVEYIVIDGGSTDGTQEVINRYIDRIAYYDSGKDDGIYYAMNKGLRHAKGDIIGILNSDDWYAGNAVELAVEQLRAGSCQMVHGRLMMVYPDGKMRPQKERPIEEIYKGMVINHPTVFAYREVYQLYGYFDESYKSASDYELMLRWYSKGVKMQFIPEILAYFRKGGYSEASLELSVAETYSISKRYIVHFPERQRINRLDEIERMREEKEKAAQASRKLKTLKAEEKEKLRKEISRSKDIMIFGTGDYGFWCYDILHELGLPIAGWLDNDKKKQGKMLLNALVRGLDAIDIGKCRIIVGTKDYGEEIVAQLIHNGLGREDYVLIPDLEEMLTCR